MKCQALCILVAAIIACSHVKAMQRFEEVDKRKYEKIDSTKAAEQYEDFYGM